MRDSKKHLLTRAIALCSTMMFLFSFLMIIAPALPAFAAEADASTEEVIVNDVPVVEEENAPEEEAEDSVFLRTGTAYTFEVEPAVKDSIVYVGTAYRFDALAQYASTPAMDANDAPSYRVKLVSLALPAGGSYTDATGATEFVPTMADKDLVYGATYVVETTEDNGATWTEVADTQKDLSFSVQEPSYSASLVGAIDGVIRKDVPYSFLGGVSVQVTPQPAADVLFEPRVLSVETPAGGSYTWAEGDTEFVPTDADSGKVYKVTYGIAKSVDNGATWEMLADGQLTTELTVVDAASVLDEIESDNVRVKDLKVDVIDGTPEWDADDNPGNDSAFDNKRVRTFDGLTYTLTFTTQTNNNAEYRHGRMYFEIVLPLSDAEAEFDTAAMGLMDTDPNYMWKVVKENGKQILQCYYELNTTQDETGNDIYPFPNQGTFPVYINVYAMKNGDIIQPTFTASVVYTDNGVSQNEGAYDVPMTVEADPVTVSAAPRYNIQLKKANDSYVGAISTFDFGTGDASALNKDKGKVFGRLQGYGITLQMYGASRDRGIRGIELPSGDITFTVDVSSKFVANGTDYGAVDTPLVWAYGKHTNVSKLNGRAISDYALQYLPGGAPYDGSNAGEFTKLNGMSVSTWNGGKWSATQVGSTVSFTVKDYVVNPFHFPSGEPGGASLYKLYYDYEKGGVENIACFSAGTLYLVMPFGGDSGIDNPEYYPNKFGVSNGSLQTVVQDANLSAQSVTGQTVNNSQQGNKGDDRIAASVQLTVPGSYTLSVNYAKPNSSWAAGMDGVVEGQDWKQGTDTQMVGGAVGINLRGVNQTQGNADNTAMAYNMLMKFDDEALEVDTSKEFVTYAPEMPTPTSTFLFAAKPDGKGWVDDAEMNALNEEDLEYYASLDELEAAGKTCIGILAEVRLPKDAQVFKQQTLWLGTFFKVKSDAALAGNVYMTTIVQNVWRRPEFLKVLDANGGAFPSRLNMAVGQKVATSPATTPQVATLKQNYQKAWYDESGYHVGSGGEPYWGDSLYIVPYKATITKQVEQKDNSGNDKFNYDLSQNHTVVDYVLNPKLEIGGDGESDFATIVTITDTLPKGIEYIRSSAVLGGTYEPNANNSMPGTVVDGTAMEPVVSYEADGTQKLTWTIENHKLSDEIPQLHYKASIDRSSNAGTVYVNTVTIGTTEDQRVHKAENSNLATAKIQVNAPALLVVKKTPDEIFVDPNSKIGFTLEWTNNAVNPYTNMVLMDTMPMSGDDKGSSYSGTYTVDSLQVTFPLSKTNADYAFYYTTDAAATGKTSKDFGFTEFTGASCTVNGVLWTKGTIAADGTIADMNGKTPTAWALLGNLDSKESLRANLKILPDGNKPQDKFVNAASAQDASMSTTVYTIDRMLSGVVWFDANYDGNRADTETLFANVKVSLLMQDAGGNWVPATTITGDPIADVSTNSRGYYSFNRLPEGQFKVVFSSSDGMELGEYRATMQNAAGVPIKTNSDAKGIYDTTTGLLTNGEIEGIVMPKAEDITSSPYMVLYQDFGLIEKAVPGKDYNTPDMVNGDMVKVGAVIPYKITYGNDETAEASKVTIVDVIDKGLTVLVDTISDNGVFTPDDTGATGGTITWTLENVPPLTYNAMVSFDAEVNEKAAGAMKVTNEATVTYTTSAGDREYVVGPLENPLEDPFKIEVVKSSDPVSGSTVKIGDTITYSLTIKNSGLAAVPFSVVRDDIPTGTTYVENSVSNVEKAPGAFVAQSESATHRAYVEWVVQDLAVGEERVLTFKVTVNSDAPSIVRNAALYGKVDRDPSDPGTIQEEPPHTTNEVIHSLEVTVVNTSTDAPKTGDSSTVFVWIAVMAVSVAGFVGVTIYNKHQRKQKQQ